MRRRILSLLSEELRISQVEIAERFGITKDGVTYHFLKLRADGIIRRVGSR
ncbi:MAG: winged helix-turn-helix domain-containing protein [Gemmatimonadota bacterium]|nr:winged helix-turn-helix domain-containing protein [Gemmatimonadota bacterium]MDE2866050.1 winged helix-turn-helix domain-containing protein [Gemmatimonadota bacterium]